MNGAYLFFCFWLLTSLAVRGEMPIRLSNYGTDCPVINVNHLAQPGEVWIDVWWSSAGNSFPIMLNSNGDSTISLSEPGFFDAGIVDLSSPWNHGDGVSQTCTFEIRVWSGGQTYEAAINMDRIGPWYQISGDPLQFPEPIWLTSMDGPFEQIIYTAVMGKGTIEQYPEGTASYQHPWPPWGPVTLCAVPEPGYRFSHWRGKHRDPDHDFTPSSGYLYTQSTNASFDFNFHWAAAYFLAVFVPASHLHLQVPYGGSISNAPAGADFDSSTEVTLTALPKAGFVFDHWAGDVVGTNASIALKMDTNRTATAHFRPVVFPQLVVQSPENGGGMTTNGFHLTLLGEPGKTYRLEASREAMMWLTVTQLVATNTVIPLADPEATSTQQRFYRVGQLEP